MITQWSREVLDYIIKYVNHSPLIYIYIVCLIFLFFRGKEKRRMIAWASVFITLLILNPVCYGMVWTKLVTYAFWRMFWMVPVIPVIACAVLDFAEMFRKAWVTPVVVSLFLVCMFIGGDNIYAQPGVFTKAENAYKLPQESVKVAEKILELEEEPVVMAPSKLYCYLRLYSGKIHMVYGRDAATYIKPIEDPEILELVSLMRANGGDSARLTSLARSKSVNLIILPAGHQFDGMEQNGFEKVADVENMWIYSDVW